LLGSKTILWHSANRPTTIALQKVSEYR